MRGFTIIFGGCLGAFFSSFVASALFYMIGMKLDGPSSNGSSSSVMGGYASGYGFIGAFIGFLVGATVFPFILSRLWRRDKTPEFNTPQEEVPPIAKPEEK